MVKKVKKDIKAENPQWEVETRRDKDMIDEYIPKEDNTQTIWDASPGLPEELIDSVVPPRKKLKKAEDESSELTKRKKSKAASEDQPDLQNVTRPQQKSLAENEEDTNTNVSEAQEEKVAFYVVEPTDPPMIKEETNKMIENPNVDNTIDESEEDEKRKTTTTTTMPESHQYFPEDPSITMFTVANSDTGFSWDQIPFQEKYQWTNPDAPCHSFVLKIPDDRDDHTSLLLCIFRHQLEFEDDSEIFINRIEVK